MPDFTYNLELVITSMSNNGNLVTINYSGMPYVLEPTDIVVYGIKDDLEIELYRVTKEKYLDTSLTFALNDEYDTFKLVYETTSNQNTLLASEPYYFVMLNNGNEKIYGDYTYRFN